jgi:hypothetical protein
MLPKLLARVRHAGYYLTRSQAAPVLHSPIPRNAHYCTTRLPRLLPSLQSTPRDATCCTLESLSHGQTAPKSPYLHIPQIHVSRTYPQTGACMLRRPSVGDVNSIYIVGDMMPHVLSTSRRFKSFPNHRRSHRGLLSLCYLLSCSPVIHPPACGATRLEPRC